MRLNIIHLTQYDYDQEVMLGVHDFYLIPQAQMFQDVLKSHLEIYPKPQGEAKRRDFIGNTFLQAWFEGKTDNLQIKSEIEIECRKFNPFAFIIDPKFLESNQRSGSPGFHYGNQIQSLLAPFVQDGLAAHFSEEVYQIFGQSADLLDFLVKITAFIHQNWSHLIREEEDIWTPDYTFSKREGSCRDLAWMQMNMLGRLGLATRFVSGYAYNPELEEGHELHAWLECYLPGAGWIGLDPSLGLMTNEKYVALAFHPYPQMTLPVQGKFAGKSNSKLSTSVHISQRT